MTVLFGFSRKTWKHFGTLYLDQCWAFSLNYVTYTQFGRMKEIHKHLQKKDHKHDLWTCVVLLKDLGQTLEPISFWNLEKTQRKKHTWFQQLLSYLDYYCITLKLLFLKLGSPGPLLLSLYKKQKFGLSVKCLLFVSQKEEKNTWWGLWQLYCCAKVYGMSFRGILHYQSLDASDSFMLLMTLDISFVNKTLCIYTVWISLQN